MINWRDNLPGSTSETSKSFDSATIQPKPMRFVLHVDEDGNVQFDFEHDELQNPGHSAYKMAKLLVMMNNGEVHSLAMAGLRNRLLQGDQVAGYILENYAEMYDGNTQEKPVVAPHEVFNIKKAIDAKG
jgi:hypothetical protein